MESMTAATTYLRLRVLDLDHIVDGGHHGQPGVNRGFETRILAWAGGVADRVGELPEEILKGPQVEFDDTRTGLGSFLRLVKIP